MKSEKRSLSEKVDISKKRTKSECFLVKNGHLIKMAISSQKYVIEK